MSDELHLFKIKNVVTKKLVAYLWCLQQGIPGRDGKDGTPGLDGEKVRFTRSSCLIDVLLDVDVLP